MGVVETGWGISSVLASSVAPPTLTTGMNAHPARAQERRTRSGAGGATVQVGCSSVTDADELPSGTGPLCGLDHVESSYELRLAAAASLRLALSR
jgi:hypothetical protein